MTAKQMVNKNTWITLIELILIIFSQRHSQYYISVNLLSSFQKDMHSWMQK